MTRQRPSQRSFRRYDPRAVLAYIARYQQQNGGRSPSQRRIQAGTGISAPSVVHNIVHRLAGRGLLTITIYGLGLPADFSLTEAGHAAVQAWQKRQADDTAAEQE